MFREVLTESQQTLLGLLSRIAEIRTFYLAGGTALALHLGNRRSRDFDFFRSKEFAPQDLLSVLRETGELEVLIEAAGTLTVRLHGVPTSFFRWRPSPDAAPGRISLTSTSTPARLPPWNRRSSGFGKSTGA